METAIEINSELNKYLNTPLSKIYIKCLVGGKNIEIVD